MNVLGTDFPTIEAGVERRELKIDNMFICMHQSLIQCMQCMIHRMNHKVNESYTQYMIYCLIHLLIKYDY